MKTIGTLTSLLILFAGFSQDVVCECYDKVKSVDAKDSSYLACVTLHREAEAEIESKMMELYKTGNRDKMKELSESPTRWRACYLPEHEARTSTITYQFEETYGKINIVDLDVKFTAHNEFTNESYITIEFADYDRMKSWEQPESAALGTIRIEKQNATLQSPDEFKPGNYPVKQKDSKEEYTFYVNYNIGNHNYSGQFNGSNPSADSQLKIIKNNGRILEVEFSLITEKGEVLKGNIQAFYPFTLF